MAKTLLTLLLDNGNSPVEDWLNNIRDKPTRVKIAFQIDKLSRSLGFTKSVKGVSELKIDIGPGYRVYYAALDLETYIVLIGAGSKKTQTRDILDAQTLWNDFVEQKKPKAALRLWQALSPSESGPDKGESDEPEKL